MKLIIVRHGETIENKRGLLQGNCFGTLSELGWQQAKKLALRLKYESIQVIYSSDQERAYNTAKEIAKFHQEIPFIKDIRLRERDVGELEGKPVPENFDWHNVPEFVENNKKFYSRIKEFLDEIYLKHKNQIVLVSTHGGSILAALSYLHNKTHNDLDDYGPIPNTAVSIVEFEEDGNHKVLLNACDKHLG